MIKNAFKYISRKWIRTLIIFLLITIMGICFFLSTILKNGVRKEIKETAKDIQNSFSLNINRRYNMGTNRGAGNIKGEDIKKITDLKEIDSYIKRVNIVADLIDKNIVQTKDTLKNESGLRKKNFGKAVMLTGVNNSSKENKFMSGEFVLKNGSHLKDGDKNKCLVHENFAKENNLKIGEKLKLKSNIYDADNEKRANEKVSLEIAGIFGGENKSSYTYAQELYENNIITDINSSAKLYGYTEDTAIYEDATFFVSSDKNLDNVIKKVEKLDIDWKMYNTVKSTNNFPKLEESINGVYKTSNALKNISFLVFGFILFLVIFFLTNTRKKEIGILLSIGVKKTNIIMQFIVELLIISTISIILSFNISKKIGNDFQKNILSDINTKIEKNIQKENKAANLGGGAEAEGLTKTLEKLEGNLDIKDMTSIYLFVILIIIIGSILSSYKSLEKNPKDLISEL